METSKMTLIIAVAGCALLLTACPQAAPPEINPDPADSIPELPAPGVIPAGHSVIDEWGTEFDAWNPEFRFQQDGYMGWDLDYSENSGGSVGNRSGVFRIEQDGTIRAFERKELSNPGYDQQTGEWLPGVWVDSVKYSEYTLRLVTEDGIDYLRGTVEWHWYDVANAWASQMGPYTTDTNAIEFTRR